MPLNDRVQFDTDTYVTPKKYGAQYDAFTRTLVELRIAKDAQQAVYILFGIIGTALLITFWMMSSYMHPSGGAHIPKTADVMYTKNAPPKLVTPLQ